MEVSIEVQEMPKSNDRAEEYYALTGRMRILAGSEVVLDEEYVSLPDLLQELSEWVRAELPLRRPFSYSPEAYEKNPMLEFSPHLDGFEIRGSHPGGSARVSDDELVSLSSDIRNALQKAIAKARHGI